MEGETMNEQIPAAPPAALTPAEEKQWAMFAHFSVLLNIFTGFLGVAAPLVIYLIYKDRSRFVAYHSLQSFVFQAVCWFGGSALAIASSILSGVIPFIGLICIPLACIFGILPLVALIYGAYGGIQVNQGQDFKYWLVGDWVQNTFMK
jgi:uncharacterized protein